MHIPDGFLDAKTWIALSVASGGFLGYAIKKVSKKIGEKHIPLIGVMSSFIFATQMLNFPVAGGTSGHFMGAALAAILLGPFIGLLVMATVLIIQCLVFQDGGLTALGANIFNMGVVGAVLSYYIYTGIKKMFGPKGIAVSAFIVGWFAIVLSASICAVELAISKTVPLKVALPAMAGVHSLIGIGEGLITVLVLSFINKIRPDLMDIEKI